MIIKVTYPKPKKRVKRVKARRESGFWANDHYITRSSILRNKYLDDEEREILLDMCSGVGAKRVKRVKKTSRCTRPVARYYVDGVVYCDGSIEEISEFINL